MDSSGVCKRCLSPGVTKGSFGLELTASGAAIASSRPGVALDFAPGSDFGPRYRIEAQLGEGGMGKVYRAWDKDVGRTVALKIVKPELAVDATIMQRFRLELMLASRISHRNILRIHDLGDVDGIKFISMAYVEGSDLHDLMEMARPMPMERMLHLARQLCEGMEAAHAEGVIHRDLKPRNVLVDTQDQVHVMDFGLAKLMDADVSMTRTGDVLGTPLYMSPEQIEGGSLDARTDVYAIGLILYEMATGALPFAGKTAMAVMHARLTQRPKPVRKLNPSIPDWYARLIAKCMERDPEDRYQRAREILADVDANQGSGSRESRVRSSVLRSIGSPAPQSTGTYLWLAVVAALLIAVGVVGVLYGPRAWASLFRAKIAQVALAPFVAAGGAEELKYEVQGINDAMTTRLSQIDSIRLLPATAVDYASRNKAFASIGAAAVVEGSVQQATGRIVVNVKVSDAAGNNVWSSSFTGDPADLITLEDQIGSALVDRLGSRVSNDEKARSGAHPTDNAAAYSLYVQGRAISRGNRDEKTTRAALALYRSAIEKDSRFALAYTGLADATLRMYDLTKDSQWVSEGLAAAQRAEGLAPNAPEVISSLGSQYVIAGQNTLALTEFERAVRLVPDSDEYHRRLGIAYEAAHRDADAMREYEKAAELNAWAWTNFNHIGAAAFGAGNYDKAIEAFGKVVKLEPQNPVGYGNTGRIYYAKGEWENAIVWFRKAQQQEDSPLWESNLAAANLYAGHYDEARRLLESAAAKAPNNYRIAGNLADAWRATGNLERARQLYAKAISLAFDTFKVNPRDSTMLGTVALDYAKSGDFSRAAEFIRRALSISPDDSSLLYKQGVIEALTGKPPAAAASLRAAFQKKYSLREAAAEPVLAGFRGSPEWAALLREFRP